MSTELINRITVKKDGVYLSSHSSNDTAPFHAWRCDSLSDIYAAEGRKGLDREIIRMLYEYAELRGRHKSLDRYRYAKDAPEALAIYKQYTAQIDDRYERLDQQTKTACGINPPKKQGRSTPMNAGCGMRCTRSSLPAVRNMTKSRKAGN